MLSLDNLAVRFPSPVGSLLRHWTPNIQVPGHDQEAYESPALTTAPRAPISKGIQPG